MYFHVYVDDDLGKKLTSHCKKKKLKRNAVVRSALAEYFADAGRSSRKALPPAKKPFASQSEWREFIRDFPHDPNFPSVEELRAGLLPPREDIF